MAAESVTDARQFEVAADADRILALVHLEEHVGELELADLEVRHFQFHRDIPAEGTALVKDGNKVVAGKVERQLFVVALADLPLHLALGLELHFALGPVDGERHIHIGQVKGHAHQFGVDIIGQVAVDLGEAFLLRFFQRFGIALSTELAENWDLSRHDPQIQFALVVALFGIRGGDGDVAFIGTRNDQCAVLKHRLTKTAAILAVNGQITQVSAHDFGRQGYDVLRFVGPAVFQPEDIRHLAVERGVVEEAGGGAGFAGVDRIRPIIGKKFIDTPLVFVAGRVEGNGRVVVDGGLITDIHPVAVINFVAFGELHIQFAAVEQFFRTAEIQRDIAHRRLVVDTADTDGETVTAPVAHQP